MKMPTSTGEIRFTRRRLTSFFKPSATTSSMNNSVSSNSADLTASQPQKIKRRTVMPRLLCTNSEKSLSSNESAESSGALKVPWNEWRRRRSTLGEIDFLESKSKGLPKILPERHFYKVNNQIQTEKENIPSCKLFPPRIMTRSRMIFLPIRKSLTATKGKRPREPSLVHSPNKEPIMEDISNCKFLPTIHRGMANDTRIRKNTEVEKAHHCAAVTKDQTDFGDYNQPGPVFGAALEDQIPSPDYPNVPLLLQVTIAALEFRGLHFVGLYRIPGRQKEISRFVSVSNLSSLNPRFMLSLPTWNDAKALTGVIKVFLRRLPQPICDPESWQHLADALPYQTEQMTKASLLATLRCIRSNLVKQHRSKSSTEWQWRFATMDFLFNHLRRVVAHEKVNSCNFKCIAICFGPSLFNADSQSQTKFNVLLELMLQHWPWLKAELNQECPSNSQPMVEYIENFLENGPDLSGDLKAFANLNSSGSGKEVLYVVERIFDRVR